MPAPARYLFLSSRTVFLISLLVVALTVVGVYVLGLQQHRPLLQNALLETSTLAIFFFVFITAGLYWGVKLKDNLGNFSNRLWIPDKKHFIGSAEFTEGIATAGEGCGGVFAAIAAWVVVAVAAILAIWLLSNMLLIFIALLYWLFFRALRLVFKNSRSCKGNIGKSMATGFYYTLLYTSWIYGIVLAAQHLQT
ncbi:hypothetical protein FVR03_21765 [Pontibacter qinzhouensis]|uniref:Uncharacterized protein n=1 Tax=Pontibacter qinzhouensis TaxID=2603253 RepID=A0A5C8IYU7_9BACT|nr:hypothetical protein [Pontibacter qinzhouensis]TXK26417.1 hypothetical protein FVR03_21765 [Pontibacter qinzhouensis]